MAVLITTEEYLQCGKLKQFENENLFRHARLSVNVYLETIFFFFSLLSCIDIVVN